MFLYISKCECIYLWRARDRQREKKRDYVQPPQAQVVIRYIFRYVLFVCDSFNGRTPHFNSLFHELRKLLLFLSLSISSILPAMCAFFILLFLFHCFQFVLYEYKARLCGLHEFQHFTYSDCCKRNERRKKKEERKRNREKETDWKQQILMKIVRLFTL